MVYVPVQCPQCQSTEVIKKLLKNSYWRNKT